MCETKSQDSASALLDVVFEQSEEGQGSIQEGELAENEFIYTVEEPIIPIVSDKQEHSALASPALSHLRLVSL